MVALADACARGEVPAAIVAVIADRSCPGLTAARERGIATDVCDYSQFESRARWSEALRDLVAAHAPDLVVSAGFMRILSPVFVDEFSGRLINLHPALLPAFPGAHAVSDALDVGVRVTGSTVHFIDHSVDHGPILLQEAVAVELGDTEQSLHERIKEAEHHMLPRACRMILEGEAALEDGGVRFRPRAGA